MKNILVVVLFGLFLSGCTGTQIAVKPDPKTIASSDIPKYDRVGLTATSTSRASYGPTGNLTEGFSGAMKEYNFAKSVAYPFRPDDKVDVSIDTKFNVTADLHGGSAALKGFFTGLTLFLIEPIVWYDQDYSIEATASVSKNGQKFRDITARTDAKVSTKWLSLGEMPKLEAEALENAKKSIYLQIMKDAK